MKVGVIFVGQRFKGKKCLQCEHCSPAPCIAACCRSARQLCMPCRLARLLCALYALPLGSPALCSVCLAAWLACSVLCVPHYLLPVSGRPLLACSMPRRSPALCLIAITCYLLLVGRCRCSPALCDIARLTCASLLAAAAAGSYRELHERVPAATGRRGPLFTFWPPSGRGAAAVRNEGCRLQGGRDGE